MKISHQLTGFRNAIIGIMVVFAFHVNAQDICNGNLGENIFEDGNFGSGTLPWLLNDPGIAPGYNYQASPPPDDGFYTITNNMNSWPWAFDPWALIQDNSNDPNGYMMVVNATFSPGIFYENFIDGLCENTLYEFSADIYNLIRPGTAGHNDPNVDFLLDDVVVFSTGNVPKNGIWNKYGFTFTTNPGQNSLNLSLRNNAPGGIGNDLALDNISFRACGPSAFVNAETNVLLCENGQGLLMTADIPSDQFIQWQLSIDGGNMWNDINLASDFEYFHSNLDPGIYLYRYLSATTVENLQNLKCRIVSDIFTIEVLPITFEFDEIICEGIDYNFGSQDLNSSGMYIESFNSVSGCDSIVTLNLEVRPNPDFDINAEVNNPACYGQIPGSIQITTVDGGIPPYTYFLNGLEDQSGNFQDLETGNYSLQVIDAIGCEETSEFELIDEVPFFIDAGPDIEIGLGETVIPNVNHNFTLVDIQWLGYNDLSCNDCIDPEIFPITSGEYIIEVENEFGCLESDTIFIKVDDTKKVYIPNSFSPNNDGINDIFEVYPSPNIVESVQRFMVFDRWGNMIQSTGLAENPTWDGKINGQNAPAGIYTYLLEIVFIDGVQKKYFGTISLIE